jgi:hypothetical protein
MSQSFDDRVIAAVRLKGPDALPSAVYEVIDDATESWFGPSLARVMLTLEQLALQGVLVQRTIVDAKGRDRRTYSIGSGRRRPAQTGADAPFRHAFA